MMRPLAEFLAHIVFPQHCPACGRLAVQYCSECLRDAAPEMLPPFCADCGGEYGVPCCYESVPCYAAALHDGAAREFILALKYKNMKGLGRAMGEVMANLVPKREADLLIPLPLHEGSGRAYNQTELIAQGISAVWNIPAAADLLHWRVKCETQTAKSGKVRKSLSYNSFEASSELAGKNVILVDDVYTTGGTIRAAKFALQRAGAKTSAVLLWTRRVSAPIHPGSWPEKEDFWL